MDNPNTFTEKNKKIPDFQDKILISRRCQSNEIEQKLQSNQSKTIERNRIIAIRLSNAIESQSNPKFWVKFDFVRFRSIAFEFV